MMKRMGGGSPRFRRDLTANPVEADGVVYVEVTDRRSGQTFRFYDFEYTVAQALDGRPLEIVADDLRAHHELELTPTQLSSFGEQLGALGFLDDDGGRAPTAHPQSLAPADLGTLDDLPAFFPPLEADEAGDFSGPVIGAREAKATGAHGGSPGIEQAEKTPPPPVVTRAQLERDDADPSHEFDANAAPTRFVPLPTPAGGADAIDDDFFAPGSRAAAADPAVSRQSDSPTAPEPTTTAATATPPATAAGAASAPEPTTAATATAAAESEPKAGAIPEAAAVRNDPTLTKFPPELLPPTASAATANASPATVVPTPPGTAGIAPASDDPFEDGLKLDDSDLPEAATAPPDGLFVTPGAGRTPPPLQKTPPPFMHLTSSKTPAPFPRTLAGLDAHTPPPAALDTGGAAASAARGDAGGRVVPAGGPASPFPAAISAEFPGFGDLPAAVASKTFDSPTGSSAPSPAAEAAAAAASTPPIASASPAAADGDRPGAGAANAADVFLPISDGTAGPPESTLADFAHPSDADKTSHGHDRAGDLPADGVVPLAPFDPAPSAPHAAAEDEAAHDAREAITPRASRPDKERSEKPTQKLRAVSGPPADHAQAPFAASGRIDAPDVALSEAPPKRSTNRRTLIAYGLLATAAALVVAGMFYKFMASSEPPAVAVRTMVPQPTTIYRYFDARGVVARGKSTPIAFAIDGKVAEILAVGAKYAAGEQLALLESGKRFAGDLQRAKERLAHYEGLREKYTAENNRPELRQAELKIVEKKRLIAEAQESLGQHALLANDAGEVGEVMAAVGDAVKSGQPVMRGKGNAWQATFELPREQADKARQLGFCRVELGGTGDVAAEKPLECSLAATGGDETHVVIELPNDPTVTEGKAARLARDRLDAVFGVPASALVRVGDSDRLYVVGPTGRAELRVVAVADKAGDQAIVTQGIDVGDRVIVTPPPGLRHDTRVLISERRP